MRKRIAKSMMSYAAVHASTSHAAMIRETILTLRLGCARTLDPVEVNGEIGEASSLNWPPRAAIYPPAQHTPERDFLERCVFAATDCKTRRISCVRPPTELPGWCDQARS